MAELTKEWLLKTIAELEEERDATPGAVNEDAAMALAAMKIALVSLEAEPAIHRWRRVTSEPYGPYPWHYGDFIGFSKPVDGIEDEYFYTDPPAPVSAPDAIEMDDDFDSAFEHGKAVGWNACRAAMLQGADGALTDEDAKRVDELVMWIKRLAHSLRKANPDSKLQSDAMDYLSRKGLIGVEDILR